LLGTSISTLAAKEPTINHGKWATVNLPFRHFSITENNDALWTCGLDETIAVSHDKGGTWQTVNREQDCKVLLDIAFIDKDTGHAAGLAD
jgi:photosystem II stability/assembly factor-like uncharacterized protein